MVVKNTQKISLSALCTQILCLKWKIEGPDAPTSSWQGSHALVLFILAFSQITGQIVGLFQWRIIPSMCVYITLLLVLGIAVRLLTHCRLPIWFPLMIAAALVVGLLQAGIALPSKTAMKLESGAGGRLVPKSLMSVSGYLTIDAKKGDKESSQFVIRTQLGNILLSYFDEPWSEGPLLVKGCFVSAVSKVKSHVGANGELPPPLSYEGYLTRQGIVATGRVERIIDISKCPPPSARVRLTKKLVNQLGNSDGLGIIMASVLGDTNLLGSQLKNSFRQTGTTHLLVISGFHISIIFFSVSFLVRSLIVQCRHVLYYLPAQIPATFAGFSAALVYTCFTGGGVSSVRAVSFIAIYSLALLLAKTRSIGRTFLISMIVVGMVYPGAALEASFQLSFMAVLGLIVAQYLNKWILPSRNITQSFGRKLWQYIVGACGSSIFAWLFTLPVCVFWFSSVSPAAPIINIVAIPLFTLVCMYIGGTALILFCLNFPLSSQAMELAVDLSNYFAKALDWTNSYFAESPLKYFSISEETWPLYLSASFLPCLIASVIVLGKCKSSDENMF